MEDPLDLDIRLEDRLEGIAITDRRRPLEGTTFHRLVDEMLIRQGELFLLLFCFLWFVLCFYLAYFRGLCYLFLVLH